MKSLSAPHKLAFALGATIHLQRLGRSMRTAAAGVALLAALVLSPPALGGTPFTLRWDAEAGNGASGAVSLHRPCTSWECGLELLGQSPPRPPDVKGTIEAGSVFRADAPDGDGWWVVVEAPGMMPMAMLWRPPTGAGDLPVLASPPAGLCSVTVRDERNEPLADATVLLGHARTSQEGAGPTQRPALLGNWRPWTPPVWTNSWGTAPFVVPAAANVPFLVGAPGRGYANGTCAPGDTLDVVLARRTTLTFQIKTERGAPLRGALARSADGWPLGVTDGRFSSDRIAPYAAPTARYRGFVGVRVSKEGYLPVTWGNIQRFASDSGGYEIPLDAGVRVTGRVLSRESGLPIPGAEIGIGNFGGRGYALALGPLEREYGPYGMAVPLTRTGMDGAFALNASTGRWDVLVRAENHAQHQVRGVEIGAGGLDLGDIRLGPGARIEGVVLDGSANPVATARIEVAGVRIERALPRPGAMDRRFNDAAVFETAPDGRFIVGGLHEDSQVNLRIGSTGFATRVLEQRSPAATPFLEVVLEPEAVIAGRVTLDGEPVPAGIQLFDQRSSLALRFSGAGDDGTFRFVGLWADRYGLEVTPGQSGVDRWRSTVEAEAGRVAEVAVELETGPPDRTLIGTVAGHGIGLANVEIRVGDFSAVTDGGGEYEIRGLRPGLHNVAADRGPERPPLMESVRIRDPTTRLDFDFSEGLVEGTAHWSDGPPVSFGNVRFFGGQRRTKVQTDGNRKFRVRLEAGEYHASALSPRGDTLASRRVRIDDFESELRLVFGRQRITGRVLGLTEREAGRLRVEAVNQQDLRTLPARVNSSGSYVIERADSGHWKVVGTVGGGERRASREVFVEDEDVEVDLLFERLHHLSGVVRLDGVPLESARVVLARELVWTEMRQSWTRDDGAFAFSDLERGEYRVGVGASIRDVAVRGDDHLVLGLVSGQVRGSFRDPETLAPRTGAQVLLWPALATQSEASRLGLILRTFTDGNGDFAFDRVPEGSWTAAMPEYQGTQSAVSVAPGSLTTVLMKSP